VAQCPRADCAFASSEPPGIRVDAGVAATRVRRVHSDCMGCGIEPRNDDVVEASCVPKAICVAPLWRGTIAPPGSEATSRVKGSCRNLGGPVTSVGMVAGGGNQRGKTGAGGIVAGSRSGLDRWRPSGRRSRGRGRICATNDRGCYVPLPRRFQSHRIQPSVQAPAFAARPAAYPHWATFSPY
jgi:hypothetical protein